MGVWISQQPDHGAVSTVEAGLTHCLHPRRTETLRGNAVQIDQTVVLSSLYNIYFFKQSKPVLLIFHVCSVGQARIFRGVAYKVKFFLHSRFLKVTLTILVGTTWQMQTFKKKERCKMCRSDCASRQWTSFTFCVFRSSSDFAPFFTCLFCAPTFSHWQQNNI